MSAETKVRIADRGDIGGIVELQKVVYPQHKRDEPFFVWQCFENVYPSILIIAQQHTSIVGMLGIQKIKTTDNLYGGQLSWIVVADREQRSGLFGKMAKLALECISGLDFIFIFANRNAVLPCEKTLAMTFIGNLSQLMLNTYSGGSIVTSLVESIDSNTAFHTIPCCESTLSLLRTERYRRWRYAKSTVYNYFKVSIPSGEYAIIKLFREKRSEQIIGDIVDFECDVRDIHRLQLLFHSASFELNKMGAAVVTTWAVPGSVLRCVLEKMGYAESDHCSHFGMKLFNHAHQHLFDFSKWHLVQSDASNY
jgi:hypothetical protein